jgi:hypothetical protein
LLENLKRNILNREMRDKTGILINNNQYSRYEATSIAFLLSKNNLKWKVYTRKELNKHEMEASPSRFMTKLNWHERHIFLTSSI